MESYGANASSLAAMFHVKPLTVRRYITSRGLDISFPVGHSMTFEQIKDQDQAYILHTYGRVDAALVKGRNARAWDVDGKEYIDFTAGIGENNAHLRQRVIEGFGYMGIKLDEAKNEACTAPNVKETIISTPDSTVKVIVIPTNEEIMIARDTLELVEKA